MASASSRRTLDTDNITFRRVFAKVYDNRNPAYGSVLTGVGDAQTYWADPSTLGLAATFNEIRADTTRLYASTSSTLSLFSDTGIGLSSLNASTLELTGRVFGRIDISGASSLFAYSNFLLNGTLKLGAEGFVSSFSDPQRNLVTISSTRQAPALSTGIIGYHVLKVNSTVTSPMDLTLDSGNMSVMKNRYSMVPSLIGYKDFLLQPNFQPTQVLVELSSYSAREFLGISSILVANLPSTISTVSSLYVDKFMFSTGMQSLSTIIASNAFSSFSSVFGFSNETQIRYNNDMGDTLARATIIQLNDQFGILNLTLSTLSSTKTPAYILVSTNEFYLNSFSTPQTTTISSFSNFDAGSIFDFRVNTLYAFSTQLSTLSTQIGSNQEGFFNTTQATGQQFIQALQSTTTGLGTLSYVSSLSLMSSLRDAGTSGAYISTQTLTSSLQGASNLGYIHQLPYLSAFSINYTLYPSRPVLTQLFVSTTQGVRDYAPYVSTLSMISSVASTTQGIFTTASAYYITVPQLKSATLSTTTGIVDHAASMFPYISSPSLASSLISTVENIGSLGYISSSSLVSTLQSTLSDLPFWSSQTLASTIETLPDYVTTSNLQSTSAYFLGWRGVFTSSIPYEGTAPYVSYPTLLSSVEVYAGQSNVYGQLSTLSSFSLRSFGPYIRESSKVVIEYHPSLLFSKINSFASGNAYPFTTELRYDQNKKQVNNSFYVTMNYLRNGSFFVTAVENCNLFQDKITLTFAGSEILPLINKDFGFFHTVFVGTQITGASEFYFQYQNFTNLTSLTNSLFVSIYN